MIDPKAKLPIATIRLECMHAGGVLTVKRNNADDETNAQHHDDERVDLEAGALVGVELEHRRAAAACTGGAGARRTGIGDFVGAVGGTKSLTGGVVIETVLLSTKLPAASAALTLAVYVVDGVRSRTTRPLSPIWLA